MEGKDVFLQSSRVKAMPSPFPGMDPYVEEPSAWTALHHFAISATVEYLQPQLRSRGYVAAPGDRVWLAEPHRPIYPDVAAFHVPRPSRRDSSQTAVLAPDEPVRIRLAEVEIREPFVEILDIRGNRLVTGIEFISPTNKCTTQGRELYTRKQAETRDAGIHLVEIDWIRHGRHILDVPETILADLPRWDYLVNLGRRGTDVYEIYPIRIRDRLPRIRIPLKEGDEDAILDLQTVFEKAYDLGPYPERLDYESDATPPLSADDAAWAEELLKKQGLRT